MKKKIFIGILIAIFAFIGGLLVGYNEHKNIEIWIHKEMCPIYHHFGTSVVPPNDLKPNPYCTYVSN